MATGITLAEASAHLAAAQTALTKARTAQLYSISDKQISRARVQELEREVQTWSRLVREMTDSAQGISNPGYILPKWS